MPKEISSHIHKIQQEAIAKNRERGSWAQEALETFCRRTGVSLDADGIETCLGDLLADLMHLSRSRESDFDAVLDSGVRHFWVEVAEETCTGDDPLPLCAACREWKS